LIFWVATVFLLPVSSIWPPRRPFLPYGRPNLALAGILVLYLSSLFIVPAFDMPNYFVDSVKNNVRRCAYLYFIDILEHGYLTSIFMLLSKTLLCYVAYMLYVMMHHISCVKRKEKKEMSDTQKYILQKNIKRAYYVSEKIAFCLQNACPNKIVVFLVFN